MNNTEPRMTTAAERIKEYIRWNADKRDGAQPIFEINLFEHPCKEVIYIRDGVEIPSGFPDANFAQMGYYYELETAVRAMQENWCDIQETVYHAGFIICRFPGLYNEVGPEGRIYYLWDPDREGFYEAEEPELFHHCAF